jgi:secreted trypsin-like serine protease
MRNTWIRGALASLALGGCVAEVGGEEADGVELADQQQTIVNGEEAVPHSQPWIVNLSIRGGFCGGSVINPSWVVTAAHCVASVKVNKETGVPVNLRGLRVVAGDHDLQRSEGTEQTRGMARIFVSPGYRPRRGGDNDIALIQLSAPLPINEQIQAIALPEASEAVPQEMLAAGWGLSRPGGNVEQQLRVGEIGLFELADCRQYGATSIEFCAGDTGAQPVDTCNGDSGGPIVNLDSTPKKLFGIVSRGDAQCGGVGVYTRANAHLDWIATTLASVATP